jgi:hypothetical protein
MQATASEAVVTLLLRAGAAVGVGAEGIVTVDMASPTRGGFPLPRATAVPALDVILFVDKKVSYENGSLDSSLLFGIRPFMHPSRNAVLLIMIAI